MIKYLLIIVPCFFFFFFVDFAAFVTDLIGKQFSSFPMLVMENLLQAVSILDIVMKKMSPISAYDTVLSSLRNHFLVTMIP